MCVCLCVGVDLIQLFRKIENGHVLTYVLSIYIYTPTYGHSSQRSSFPFDTYREYLHILEIVRLTLIIITTAIERAFGGLYFQLKSHSMIFEQAWFHFMLVACSKHQVHENGSNGLKPPTTSSYTCFLGCCWSENFSNPYLLFIRWPVLY